MELLTATSFRFHQVQMGRTLLQTAALLVALITITVKCHADPTARLIEVSDDTATYRGRVVARNGKECIMMDQFGVLVEVPVSRVQSFKVVDDTFRAAPTSEFRKVLLAEFHSGYEIQLSSHFVVVGKKGRAKAYAALFEEIYRQVNSFYRIRGMETSDPEVPLVAIVFGTQAEFKEYSIKDEIPWSRELRGYYSLKTNRAAMFEDSDPPDSEVPTAMRSDAHSVLSGREKGMASLLAAPDYENLAALLKNVPGETASTIIHETTHQVGYNIGVHSRLGETPTWVIEGLATVLEAPGMRTRGKSSVNEKVNTDLQAWFNADYASRRQFGDLAQMISADDMFRNNVLDAYSNAWAVTYFLTDNPVRARAFMHYLKLLSERDPLRPYTAEERLKDFQSVFGDISRLEVDFLRAMERLDSQ